MWKNTCKLLLFDLDGTLLQSDKTISKRTLSVLKQCREKGILIGVSTSRSEQNSLVYLKTTILDQSWGDSIYTDFSDFTECSLKMCVEIFEQDKADELADRLSDCDCIRFSDGYWYKFTKKNVTKENAIMKITEVCGFATDSIIAFGDDYADIGMLELCGTGVAMGNAIDEVKNKADIVIGSNDEDGIADFIESECIICH